MLNSSLPLLLFQLDPVPLFIRELRVHMNKEVKDLMVRPPPVSSILEVPWICWKCYIIPTSSKNILLGTLSIK